VIGLLVGYLTFEAFQNDSPAVINARPPGAPLTVHLIGFQEP
jgi:hypothetical protein